MKKPRLGGTCLQVGCIPTKSLLHTADVWDYFKHSEEEGIQCENPRLDYPAVVDRKNKIVTKHSKGVEFLMRKNKVDVIKGYARLLGGGRIEVEGAPGKQILETKNIMIATGSEARMLPGLQPDAKLILTNIEILNLTNRSQDAGHHRRGRRGRRVCVHVQPLRFQSHRPRDAAARRSGGRRRSLQGARKVLQEDGHSRGNRRRVESVRRNAASVSLTAMLSNGSKEELEAEKLLVAVGRKPNTENIGLEKTRVELDRGFIKVDGQQRTAEPGVYAIGDIVAGTPQLAHVATAEGMVAVGNIAGKPRPPINRNRIPGALIRSPESAAWV